MPNYFKCSYPPGIAYSPTWYGTLNWVPPATVLLYNDEEGWCIGYMDSPLPLTTVGGERMVVITEQEARAILQKAQVEERLPDTVKEDDILEHRTNRKVWHSDFLTHRWDEPKEVERAQVPLDEVAPEDIPAIPSPLKSVVVKYCPTCHKQVVRIFHYEDDTIAVERYGKAVLKGIKARNLNLWCPDEHKVKVTLD